MFIFFPFVLILKSVFCAVLRVCTVYLKWFLCKIFSSLYLLLICANANKTSHYRNYCVNKKQEFTSSFSKILLKQPFKWENWPIMHTTRAFFQNQRTFFQFLKKGMGEPLVLPPPIVARLKSCKVKKIYLHFLFHSLHEPFQNGLECKCHLLRKYVCNTFSS